MSFKNGKMRIACKQEERGSDCMAHTSQGLAFSLAGKRAN